ncbi:MAG: SUMF1/EgtB/PvdO family nonheme iron enzyme [Myxococcota bacterium]
MLLLVVAGCSPPTVHRPDGPAGRSDATDTTDDTDAPCPAGMALVGSSVCVDRYEAALEVFVDGDWSPASPFEALDGSSVRAVMEEGITPQGYISADEAETACEASNKRLCTTDEWLAACQGPEGWTFPYGGERVPGACNDTYAGAHPVVDYFGTNEGVWDPTHMNDPGINQQAGTVSVGGAFSQCRTPDGIFDLHGNLHEWVSDAEGTFRGGFYADASINGPGCLYRTLAHGRRYHDYSTGFRCCQDAKE